MNGYIKNLGFAAFPLILAVNSHSQQPSVFWRALFVLADSLVHDHEVAHPDWIFYTNNLIPDVQLVNDIYAASGMDSTRMQIAGVIRDQTNYPPKIPISQLFDLHNPDGPLKKYISLRNQYAADIIILMNKAIGFGGGVVLFIGPPDSGYGAMLSTTFDGQVYAHEAGHIHGLEHCHGYRRSFDAQGNYVTSGAALGHGFHTVMSYTSGTPYWSDQNPCEDFGDSTDVTRPTLTFADTSLTWWNDSTQRVEVLGALAIPPFTVDHIDVPLHKANSATIRALVNTPTNLTIADTMSLHYQDFADFLATESAIFEPGFSVTGGGIMRVSVGSAVMTKWGVDINREHLISDGGILPRGLKGIKNFNLKYKADSKSLLISFNNLEKSKVSVAFFDFKGKLWNKLDGGTANGGAFSKNFSLQAMPKGGYIVRVSVGNHNFYKRFTMN